jgi:hypothetical protein
MRNQILIIYVLNRNQRCLWGTSIITLAYLYVCRRHKANKIDVILCFSKADN